MATQQKQLDELAVWLEKMEERIRNQEPIGSELDAIKLQIANHKVYIHVHIKIDSRSNTAWKENRINDVKVFGIPKIQLTFFPSFHN